MFSKWTLPTRTDITTDETPCTTPWRRLFDVFVLFYFFPSCRSFGNPSFDTVRNRFAIFRVSNFRREPSGPREIRFRHDPRDLNLVIPGPLSTTLNPAYCGSKRCRVRLPTGWWAFAARSWTTWARTVRRSDNCWTAVFRARPLRSCARTPCPAITRNRRKINDITPLETDRSALFDLEKKSVTAVVVVGVV